MHLQPGAAPLDQRKKKGNRQRPPELKIYRGGQNRQDGCPRGRSRQAALQKEKNRREHKIHAQADLAMERQARVRGRQKGHRHVPQRQHNHRPGRRQRQAPAQRQRDEQSHQRDPAQGNDKPIGSVG